MGALGRLCCGLACLVIWEPLRDSVVEAFVLACYKCKIVAKSMSMERVGVDAHYVYGIRVQLLGKHF